MQPVGSIGLKIGSESGIGTPETEAEIGYWIGVPYWGSVLGSGAYTRSRS